MAVIPTTKSLLSKIYVNIILNPDSLPRSTWDIIDRFWNLDLSYTDEKLKNRYSVFGPKLRTPSCMHRSYLLSLDFKVTSLTEWAAQLKINPLYANLSGFEFGDTPGVDTFYDFFNRLWDSDEDNLSPHIHPIKASVNKPSAKEAKAKPVEKISVEQLLQELENTSFSISEQPYGSLFDPFNREFPTFPSPIVTSDGIHPVPVFIMDTIYICWLLLIPSTEEPSTLPQRRIHG